MSLSLSLFSNENIFIYIKIKKTKNCLVPHRVSTPRPLEWHAAALPLSYTDHSMLYANGRLYTVYTKMTLAFVNVRPARPVGPAIIFNEFSRKIDADNAKM